LHELLKAGQSVIATSRKPEALQAEINGRYDVETLKRALVVGLDVSKVEEVKAVFSKAIDKFGRIDVVVNNAGYVSLIVKRCDEKPCINLNQIRPFLEKWRLVLSKARAINLKSCFGDQFIFVKR
jgi:NAD(P)-dependent dehydrogenase (short-subunit alcohol dehydrogenase family)